MSMLGATFEHGDRVGRIGYLDPRRERLLEDDIAVALSGLGQERTPRIGILSPLLSPSAAASPRDGLAVLEEVQRAYDVAIIPYFAGELPDLDLLLVIDAAILKPEMLHAIDQHVMRGKGLIVMLTRIAVPPASAQVTWQPSEAINDISDLLLRYGVRYRGEEVVAMPAWLRPWSIGPRRGSATPTG